MNVVVFIQYYLFVFSKLDDRGALIPPNEFISTKLTAKASRQLQGIGIEIARERVRALFSLLDFV